MLQFRTRPNPEGAWVNAAGEPVDVLLIEAATLQPGAAPCYEFTKPRMVPLALGCKPNAAGAVAEPQTEETQASTGKKASKKKSHA